MHDDLLVQQALAGITKVVGERLPTSFGVCLDRPIEVRGGLAFRPAAVVAARTRLGVPVLAVGSAGTAIEIGCGQGRRPAARRAYDAVGLLCVWRLELRRHPSYRGPVPVIFVRTRMGPAWRERFALRGVVTALPLCLGDGGGGPQWISVPVDPGRLTC